MASLRKMGSRSFEEPTSPAEEEAKVKALREALGPLSDRATIFCTDECLKRYLRARGWNVPKSTKMLKEALKWRATYKPEEIKWEEVQEEAKTGKVYRASVVDRDGRTVIVMRPANQNTSDQYKQIRHLVHSLENAILNLPPDQESMVWLIDFKGWTLRKAVPISQAREVAYVLQNMYPERLAIAILYDPPKLFEAFWAIVKPFLDPKTFKKVRFVYTKNKESLKAVEEFFDLDVLEVPFGGRNTNKYNHQDYANQMKLDDLKTAQFWRLDGTSDASTDKLHTLEKGDLPDVSTIKLDSSDKGGLSDVSTMKVDGQEKDPASKDGLASGLIPTPEAAQTA